MGCVSLKIVIETLASFFLTGTFTQSEIAISNSNPEVSKMNETHFLYIG